MNAAIYTPPSVNHLRWRSRARVDFCTKIAVGKLENFVPTMVDLSMVTTHRRWAAHGPTRGNTRLAEKLPSQIISHPVITGQCSHPVITVQSVPLLQVATDSDQHNKVQNTAANKRRYRAGGVVPPQPWRVA